MIRKITNWTFGSIFRTIGRIIAYILIGLLISFIITKNDYIKAETISPSAFAWTRSPIVCSGGSAAEPANCSLYEETVWDINNSTWGPMNNEKALGKMKFRYNFNTALQSGTTYTFKIKWSWDNKDFLDTFTMTELQNNSDITKIRYATTTQTLNSTSESLGTADNPNNATFRFENQVNNAWNIYIYITYTPPEDVKFLEFNIFTGNGVSNSSLTSWGPVFYGYTEFHAENNSIQFDTTGVGNAINNQTQIIQQNFNSQNEIINNGFGNITSILNDSNTTQAESEYSNFFSNFTTQDNGGISSIITAPLTAISSLSSARCNLLELPLPYINSSITLPCMTPIYREYFGAAFSIYQTIIFGAVAYRIVLSLFMMIKGFKNPDDDKIEVVDL